MPDESVAQFTALLWGLQAEAGMSNAELARHLGVTQSFLSRLRSGDRGKDKAIRLDLALRAAALFPELALFLSEIIPIRTDNGDSVMMPRIDADADEGESR